MNNFPNNNTICSQNSFPYDEVLAEMEKTLESINIKTTAFRTIRTIEGTQGIPPQASPLGERLQIIANRLQEIDESLVF